MHVASGLSRTHGLTESDWKVFRELREIALERFYVRTLEEIQAILCYSAFRTTCTFRILIPHILIRSRKEVRRFLCSTHVVPIRDLVSPAAAPGAPRGRRHTEALFEDAIELRGMRIAYPGRNLFYRQQLLAE